MQIADGHHALIDALHKAGFSAEHSEPWRGLWLDLPAPAPTLPAGYSIRPMEPAEHAERVAVHRAAWLPADLPYAPGRRPDFAPDATSAFTDSYYEEVRRSPAYGPSLDLVAVAPDGSFAACCIGWPDEALGVAEVEPLGVHPNHRRLGLAGALCLEVAARCSQRGARGVFINTGPRSDYPAPAGAYLKAGFRLIDRGWTYKRAET